MSKQKRDMTNPTTRITAPPGTAEYQSQMLAQGQAAMDRAVAMPLVRIAFGFFSAMFAVSLLGRILTPWFEGGWQAVLRAPHAHDLSGFAMMIGFGAIAFTGRSPRRWFYEIFARQRNSDERNPPAQPTDATKAP